VEDDFNVSVQIYLGDLLPEEIDVQLYYGRMKRIGELEKGLTQKMAMVEDLGEGQYRYKCTVTCLDSGRYGFTVRVGPQADDWIRYTPGLLTWA
jgi:starch phosphorylase